MNRQTILVLLLIIFSLGTFAFIYAQQQILTKELESIQSTTPRAATTLEPETQPRPVKKGKYPVIDPKNDPLAPMVKAKMPEQKSPSKTIPEPTKVHERPLANPILAQ